MVWCVAAANLSQEMKLEENPFAKHPKFFEKTVSLLWGVDGPASLSRWPLDAQQTETYGTSPS